MTAIERLKNGQKNTKQVYLITDKLEMINERDLMESNWNNSMTERMRDLAIQSIRVFNTPLSKL